MDFERTGIGPELEAVKAMIALRLVVLTHFVKTLQDGSYVQSTIKSDRSSKGILHEPDTTVIMKQSS